MKFWKYHVNGNDFILLESSHKMHPSQITMLCDRHKGIGADGILCVAEEEQVRYLHYNADGSVANMCGNGIRCVAHYICTKRHLSKIEITILGQTYTVALNDHIATLYAPIPKVLEENRYNSGVNHLIVSAYTQSEDDNVDVVKYRDDTHFEMTTYELGVGETLSCGTGMIAAFYHGVRNQLLSHMAIGTSKGGYNLLYLNDDSICLSSCVHEVYSGNWNERK